MNVSRCICALIASLSLSGCTVQIDDFAQRSCDSAHACLTGFLCEASRCTSDSANLVQDPGFEAQTASRQLQLPWFSWSVGPPSEAGTDLSGFSRTGDKSGFIYAPDAPTRSWTAISQNISVHPNTRYRLTAWVRTSSNLLEGFLGIKPTPDTVTDAISAQPFAALGPYTSVTLDFDSGSQETLNVFAGIWTIPADTTFLQLDDLSVVAQTSP